MTIYAPDVSIGDTDELVPGRPGTVQLYLRDVKRVISIPQQYYIDTWRRPHTQIELMPSGAIRVWVTTAGEVNAGGNHLEIGGG